MKQVFLLIFLLVVKISFSQSKKEQIEILTIRVDSLNQLVTIQTKTINDKNDQISKLNTNISNLESSISSLTDNVSKLTSDLKTSKSETATKTQEISKLQAQLKIKADSLTLVHNELEKIKPTSKIVVTNNVTNQVTQTGSYKSVKIGNQTWMAENLNVSTFRNGDQIPEVKNGYEWGKAGENKQPAWCYYENDPKNGAKYGKLYNWYAVIDPRGLAPDGWHVPTKDEWDELINFIGYEGGGEVKSKVGWENWEEDIVCSNCVNWNFEYRKKTACHLCKDTRLHGKKVHTGNGSNKSGFLGLPSGVRIFHGEFSDIGSWAGWWSISEEERFGAYSYSIFSKTKFLSENDHPRGYGYSVRCIKD